MTIPNFLSFFRILATPVTIYFFICESYGLSFVIFLVAALTDFFDGIIARRLNQSTPLGALLDPVADKVFEMSFTLALGVLGDLPIVYVFLLNLRNFAQLMSIPILMWWKRITFNVQPSMIAKWGSALGMFVIGGVILLKGGLSLGFAEAGMLYYPLMSLIFVSALFEIYMLVTYLPRFYLIYKGKHDTFN